MDEGFFGLFGGGRKPATFPNGHPVPRDWTDEDYRTYQAKYKAAGRVPGMDPHAVAANDVTAAKQGAVSVTSRAANRSRTVSAPPPEQRYPGDLRKGVLPAKDMGGYEY